MKKLTIDGHDVTDWGTAIKNQQLYKFPESDQIKLLISINKVKEEDARKLFTTLFENYKSLELQFFSYLNDLKRIEIEEE